MKAVILKWILFLFAKRGIILQVVTPKKRIEKLIESLHPIRTQFELIRLGRDRDGGYLVPNCLEDIEACFSPGVAQVSEFERDCIDRGMKVFMADYSVDMPNWDLTKDKYSFEKKFIGSTNNEEFMTMDSWFRSSGLSNDAELMLQMDIESGEYDAIINMSDELMSRFKIMVIEFHQLQHLWNRGFFGIMEIVIKKILQTHICVHIHPNNYRGPKDSIYSIMGIDIPRILEMTFIRKDIAMIKGYQPQFPHPLDCDNTKKGHYPLPENWYHHPTDK